MGDNLIKKPTPTVCVVGSVNLDLVVTGPRLPSPGETVTGGTFERHPGGKGANQALAARRQGAEVALIAAVGADPMAEQALELLRRDGVDLSRLVTAVDAPTGVALITVDQAGENQISVAPGANARLEPGQIDVRGFDAVLCQLEIPDDTVTEAALQATGLFCLNAAPARPLPEPILRRADVIIVNEPEHDSLGQQLAGFGGLLVVTRGARGADVFQNGERVATAEPPAVDAVDTVGAGDAFCGTLVTRLAGGEGIEQALSHACEAGATATTRPGAQNALLTAGDLPTRS